MQQQKRPNIEGSGNVNSAKTEEFSIVGYRDSSDKPQQPANQIQPQIQRSEEEESGDEHSIHSSQKQKLHVQQVQPGQLQTINQDLEKSEYESQAAESLQGSIPPSEIKALMQSTQKRPMFLNIMVAGQSGLGKSTFIDVLLRKKLRQNKIIRDSTMHIQEIEGQLQYEQFTMKMKFIDTPGYRPNFSIRAWIRQLTNYIQEQYDSYHRRYELQFQSKQQFQESKHKYKDERVHVCFYFFQGPRILSEDIMAMKKLSQLVNVIPILAKGDSYTKMEIQEIKMHFSEQLLEFRIEIFKGQDHHHQSNFGQVPPYVIISSVEEFCVDNKVIYGRKFPWGICDIFNPMHSDVSILYRQLVGEFSRDLISMTDFFQTNYLKLREKKKNKQKGLICWLLGLFST